MILSDVITEHCIRTDNPDDQISKKKLRRFILDNYTQFSRYHIKYDLWFLPQNWDYYTNIKFKKGEETN